MTKIKTISKVGNLLEINGEYYYPISKQEQIGKIIFEKIDRKKYEKKVYRLVKVLKKHLNKEDILRDAIGEMSIREITAMDVLLKQKTKPKIRQRRGCLELTVGDVVVPIR